MLCRFLTGSMIGILRIFLQLKTTAVSERPDCMQLGRSHQEYMRKRCFQRKRMRNSIKFLWFSCASFTWICSRMLWLASVEQVQPSHMQRESVSWTGGLVANKFVSEPVDEEDLEGNVASVLLVVDTVAVDGSPWICGMHVDDDEDDDKLVPEDDEDEADDDEDDLLLLLVGYDEADDERLAEIRFPTSKCSDVKSQVEFSSGESLVLGLNVATPLQSKQKQWMVFITFSLENITVLLILWQCCHHFVMGVCNVLAFPNRCYYSFIKCSYRIGQSFRSPYY